MGGKENSSRASEPCLYSAVDTSTVPYSAVEGVGILLG